MRLEHLYFFVIRGTLSIQRWHQEAAFQLPLCLLQIEGTHPSTELPSAGPRIQVYSPDKGGKDHWRGRGESGGAPSEYATRQSEFHNSTATAESQTLDLDF